MSILEDWNAKHLERYREQVAAGEHDAECEQRERSSLCHCHKRKREVAGLTELPMLTFPAPFCDTCLNEVEYDGDGCDCRTCRASWDKYASDGDHADQWTDDHGPQDHPDIPWGGEQFGERLYEIVTEAVQ